MNFSPYVLIPILVAASACGTATQETAAPEPGPAASNVPAQGEVLAKIYDPDYSTPDGFFVDERANDPTRSYTVHHVLDPSGSFELCSDDIETAQQWEDADNAERSVQGYYVGSHETARYYEFIRELSYDDGVGNIDDVTSPGYARVFKCSDTNRNGVDRNLLDGYAGTINARPLTVDTVREFTEYLWQFAFFPQARKAVLASTISTGPDALTQTLQLAFASTQGSSGCDLIEVAEWHYIADRASGEVQKRFDVLIQFEARPDGETPVVCQ